MAKIDLKHHSSLPRNWSKIDNYVVPINPRKIPSGVQSDKRRGRREKCIYGRDGFPSNFTSNPILLEEICHTNNNNKKKEKMEMEK
jgi:hypothetical protein